MLKTLQTLAGPLMLCLTAVLLTSCNSGGRGTEYCAIASPILVSRADVLTDQTAREILQHNEVWKRLCR